MQYRNTHFSISSLAQSCTVIPLILLMQPQSCQETVAPLYLVGDCSIPLLLTARLDVKHSNNYYEKTKMPLCIRSTKQKCPKASWQQLVEYVQLQTNIKQKTTPNTPTYIMIINYFVYMRQTKPRRGKPLINHYKFGKSKCCEKHRFLRY